MSRAQQGRAKHGGKNGSRSKRARQQKHVSVEDEMRDIEERCQTLLASKTSVKRFDELPITSKTLTGLRKAAFVETTDIQARSLPLALAGRDILGAAQTGSGKTLAFVIPVLERLYRERWGAADGLGALIISPTRELAIQIFEVLRKVGIAHTFSAGLVIGGKDVKVEKDRLDRMNIVVATPGRLLQHMDQTVGFDASNVQVLVLDEADRCLDMGFANTLDAILDNLPKSNRQTLLFSATQTKRVKDLARLSLESPEYVAVQDANKQGVLPPTLQQHYMTVTLPRKLSVLFSFIRTHLRSKVLVFFSACRQVQFVHETFCKLRPGMPLMCLHGKQKQTKRLDIFTAFTRSQHAVLFATDVAARGLDFPKVDWVIQVDAPEDADTYIHRVGRTARYNSKGNSLIFVLPSEETGLLKSLGRKDIKPEVIKPKDSKVQDIREQLQGFLFHDTELKALAQKAFVSYVRSIYLQRDKATFDVTQLPINDFAESLGLAGAPKVKFIKEAQAAKKKAERMLVKEQGIANGKASTSTLRADSESLSGSEQSDSEGDGPSLRRIESNGQNAAVDVGSESEQDSSEDEAGPRYKQAVKRAHSDSEGSDSDEEEETNTSAMDKLLNGDTADDEEDFLVTRDGTDNAAPVLQAEDDESHLSKRRLQLGASRKRAAAAGLRGVGDKIVFDDDGQPRKIYELPDDAEFQASKDDTTAQQAASEYLERERTLMLARDVEDKARARDKRQEKKRMRRERDRQQREEGSDDEGNGGVRFMAPQDTRDDGYETPDFDVGDSDTDSDGAVDPASSPRAAKRSRHNGHSLAADEDLALQLLGS